LSPAHVFVLGVFVFVVLCGGGGRVGGGLTISENIHVSLQSE
jgi:hypothetical protein